MLTLDSSNDAYWRNSNLISSNLTNSRKLWNSVNKLLHRKPHIQLPTSFPSTSLPQMFADFFSVRYINFTSIFYLIPLTTQLILLLLLPLRSLPTFLVSLMRK